MSTTFDYLVESSQDSNFPGLEITVFLPIGILTGKLVNRAEFCTYSATTAKEEPPPKNEDPFAEALQKIEREMNLQDAADKVDYAQFAPHSEAYLVDAALCKPGETWHLGCLIVNPAHVLAYKLGGRFVFRQPPSTS